jgi:large subunit ribosomal protein L9
VEVAEGYGRNFLIKTGAGKLAVGGILKDAQNKKEQKELEIANKNEKEREKLGQINKKEFKLKARASDKGHLFAAVHKKDIAKLIGVDKENLLLKNDIKETGVFEINLKLGGKKGKVILVVEAE